MTMPRSAVRYRRDHDTARFTQILRTKVDARRRVTVFAGPPPGPAADAIAREFYWLNVDPKAAADAIRNRYATVLELCRAAPFSNATITTARPKTLWPAARGSNGPQIDVSSGISAGSCRAVWGYLH
jgi:hypothetical protein